MPLEFGIVKLQIIIPANKTSYTGRGYYSVGLNSSSIFSNQFVWDREGCLGMKVSMKIIFAKFVVTDRVL